MGVALRDAGVGVAEELLDLVQRRPRLPGGAPAEARAGRNGPST